jgi:adenylate cyclase
MVASHSNGDITPPPVRRLAAFAFVDIVGYSILMARDETRTHRRWMTILNEVIRPKAAEHRGTIVKSTGDGVLVEFPSAFNAVEWAREVQRLVHPRPEQQDASPQVMLRIAVHLGDIIWTEEDIYGDNVNVAARLQEYAEPGGVVMSETVYDLVRGSIGSRVSDLGVVHLKNFEKPVRVYALSLQGNGVILPDRQRLASLPSIAVLPLENVGGNPADDYFCDGIVEDITLSLAGLRELIVVSRGSTLAYRGRPADPREVGRVLGVRYVLAGTLRRSERAVRVSVELCDARSGTSLWRERAEVLPGELFDVQDHIVTRIAAGIAPNVRAAELRSAMRKRPENFTAYDYTLRALHIINSLDKDTFLQARDYLDKAMSEDPSFAMPIAWAARWHSLCVGQGWSTNPRDDAEKAVELAARAIELDRQNALALATYGHLISYLFHECDSALVYFDRALSASPSHSLAWLLSSATLGYVGRGEQAVRHAEQGLRLSPFDQSLYYYYEFLNLAHYSKGDYEGAVKWGKMSERENPRFTANYRYLAAALAALGRLDEAKEAAANLMKLEANFRLGEFERTRQPFRPAEMAARHMEHLRKAGLPE